MTRNAFFRPIPPFNCKKRIDRILRAALLYRPCRYASDNCVWRYVFCDNRAGFDDGTVTDCHTGQNDDFIADPDVISDYDITLIVPRCCYIRNIQIPFLKKDWKRIGGKGGQRMVGAGEEKFCSAGN